MRRRGSKVQLYKMSHIGQEQENRVLFNPTVRSHCATLHSPISKKYIGYEEEDERVHNIHQKKRELRELYTHKN